MIDYQFFINYAEQLSYLGIFILLAAVGFIITVPEEILLLSVGYLSALGFSNVYIATAVGLMGVLTGDSFLFWLSKRGSKYIIAIREKFKEGKIERYEQRMKNNIGMTLFVLRFIVGIRLFGPLLAGSLQASWTTFLVYDVLALLIYVPMFILLWFHFHNQLAAVISDVVVIRHIIFILVVAVIGIGLSIFARNTFLKE